VLAQAEKAFENAPQNRRDEKFNDRCVEHLQGKLVNRNQVIVDLMEASVLAKKNWGNSERRRGSPRHS